MISRKVEKISSPFDKALVKEADYNSYLWQKADAVTRYLETRSQFNIKSAAGKYFENNGFTSLGLDEFYFLYPFAYKQETSIWFDNPQIDNPFTPTPSESYLNLKLKEELGPFGDKNTSLHGVQMLPCRPNRPKKILIGNYSPDAFLFGVRPCEAVTDPSTGKLMPIYGMAIELNGPVHDEPGKVKKDLSMDSALLSLGIFTLQSVNDDLRRGSNGIVRRLINNLGVAAGPNVSAQETNLLKMKICCRTVAVHLNLEEIDEVLRRNTGWDYRIKEGFDLAMANKRNGGTWRQIYDLKRLCDRIAPRNRPPSMGSMAKKLRPNHPAHH